MSDIMPPEIAKAIIAVKKRVRLLAHDEQNKYQGFRYTSVDAFYTAIGPLMAEAGLFTIVDEAQPPIVETRETTDDRGQTKSGKWLSTNYAIRIFHESGACYGPIHRTMVVRASGPQSFGHGMSYVDKYFLRGLFKVPTGEAGEIDSHEQNGLPDTRNNEPEPDWAAIAQSGTAQLRQAKTLDDLRRIWDMLLPKEQEACAKEKDRLKAALQPSPAIFSTVDDGPSAVSPKTERPKLAENGPGQTGRPAPEAEPESPVTRWVQLLGIAGQDLRAVNALIRDDFLPLKVDVGTRNEIWTLIQNQGRANGWRWNRENMSFSPKEEA